MGSMMMSSDLSVVLNPCSFCGSMELLLTNESDHYGRGSREMVACGGCGTHGPWGQDEQDASMLWNKRCAQAVLFP
ncbi:Lar family restriction alleviation protein [uncultured Lamprocystis sp.]|uniref:Lar family restriction alleviation protein n=1 Tax=uncultured Lamprocystis sp. TaxID=543132 RepID=UPI00342DAB9F